MGISGAQALIKCLKEAGVDTVFGIPGGSVLPVYDALYDSGIRHVLVRLEQAGVHAASGYARIKGQPGVCLATSGPGATNLVTGLATAYMDSIPLVAITGQVPTSMVGTDAFQEVDITGITIPITKHNYLVKDVNDLPRILKEAFHIAGTGRPGPVLVDIPKDVAVAECLVKAPVEVDLKGYKPNYQGHPTQIKNLVRLIEEAERPLIYAGGGIVSSKASDLLVQLALAISAPVTTTLMGLGSFPEIHPLALGMLGLHGRPCANLAVGEADLIIGLGVRFDDRVTGLIDKFAPQAKKVHVDIDPAEIGKNVEVNLPIVGELSLVMREVLRLTAPARRQSWLDRIQVLKEERPLRYRRDGNELRPQYIIEQLGELSRHQAIVTADVGQHQMWTAQYYGFARPGSFLTSGGLGTMGYGFPAAIGAQLADPDALVVTVTGDGSFQMHLAEMATAVEQNLPVKILLLNNNNLGMVRQLQRHYCDNRYIGIEYTGNPDFMKLALCYGAAAYQIADKSEVRPVLAEALNNKRLTIIECLIKRCEMVYPMVPNAKGLQEMIEFEQGEE
ncbi:MAG: biosynthetic-type acetolactate synthase large subunit [Syntrophomonadaceae bacterium]|nr:biosynthetic-type acetolactate synthase large subunit [Syntrophomonadaceae bacterium]